MHEEPVPIAAPAMQGPAPATHHIRYLDGLRGIAILMVVMVHTSQLFVLPAPLANTTFYGVRGVQLFFIVSGLTLTMVHVDRPLELPNFAARRFFRIAPMFYLGALLYLALGATTTLRFAPHDANAREIAMTFAFVHDWSLTANNKVVPGGWSIGCEAMFYLVFPAMLVLLKRMRGQFWPVLVCCYVAGGLSNLLLRRYLPGDSDLVKGFAFSFWLTQLPAFMSGCWLAFGAGHGTVSRRMAGGIAVLAVLLLVVDSQLKGRSNLLVAVALLSLFVWAIGRARPAFLDSRTMAFLGEVSFSVYLIHFAIVAALEPVAPWLTRHAGPIAGYLVLFGATLAITLPIAALTYRWIETPFIRLSRQLLRTPRPARS